MIDRLWIKNFKSIKDLQLDCKRVNVFIGEPNTGKSNILEALGFLSWSGKQHEQKLKDFIRLQSLYDLFFNNNIEEGFEIRLIGKEDDVSAELMYKDNSFIVDCHENGKNNPQKIRQTLYRIDGDYADNISFKKLNDVKFYRFIVKNQFPLDDATSLAPPNGDNLFRVIKSHPKIKDQISQIFLSEGYKLSLKPADKSLELFREDENIIINHPYILLSDTLQRIVFYTVALESNHKSVIVLEEPEAHAFPYYVKHLGERIGLYSDNQFFIATHNPYLLTAIAEKTPLKDIRVMITYMKNYQTKVMELKDDQISELMEFDPFFNAKRFIPDSEGIE